MIFGAVYLLYMFQKVFFGKLDKARNGHLKDLNAREMATFVPIVILIFVLGLFPRPALQVMEPSVQKFIRDYHRKVAEPDGPSHVYGQLPAAKTPPVAAVPSTPPPGAPQGGAQ